MKYGAKVPVYEAEEAFPTLSSILWTSTGPEENTGRMGKLTGVTIRLVIIIFIGIRDMRMHAA